MSEVNYAVDQHLRHAGREINGAVHERKDGAPLIAAVITHGFAALCAALAEVRDAIHDNGNAL